MRVILLALLAFAVVPLLGRQRFDGMRACFARFARGGAKIVMGLVLLSITRTFLENPEALPLTALAAGMILFGLLQATGWFTSAARPTPAAAGRPKS